MSKELDGRIAVALGWRSIKPAMSRADSLTGLPAEGLRTFVPRWSSSLDLMWELEGKLVEKDYIDYCVELMLIFQDKLKACASIELVVHATAEQKARAWLEVKEGK